MAGKIRNLLSFLTAIVITIIFCIPVTAAQDTAFRLDMDSLNLQKGVSSAIVVSLINAQDAQIVSIDGIEGFDILSQSSSTTTSITNNVSTYQTDIYYTIMPKTVGQFTLKANITYDGKNYETNSLNVTVTESSGISGTTPDLFVKTILSHDEAYLGEKILVTYEVYSRSSVDSLGFTDYTAIDGVISKELPDYQIKSESVYIDGNKYAKYEIKQLIIDPIKTGVCTVPSFNVQVNVINDTGFGGFGGLLRSTTPKYLQTEEAEILIKQLPSDGKPDNFSGIVGELNLSGNYSRTELNYGDSLSLQVEASGNCNLDGLKNILTGTVTGFAVYENQKNTSESVENNEYYAQKNFEAVLVPERNGALNIPPVSVSYFNPVTGRYETAEIPETTINVLGDMPQLSVNDGGGLPVDYENVVINQISYENVPDGYYNVRIQKEVAVVILIGFIIILVFAVTMWFILRGRKRNTTLKTMYKRLMVSKDVNEIYNCFNGMIKYCFGLNLKASSKSSITGSLTDPDLAVGVTEIMDYMESAEVYGNTDVVYLKNKIKSLYAAKLRKI